jgi:hypothetical protein
LTAFIVSRAIFCARAAPPPAPRRSPPDRQEAVW